MIKSRSYKNQPIEVKEIFSTKGNKVRFNKFFFKKYNRYASAEDMFIWVKTRLDSNTDLFLEILKDNNYINMFNVLESNYIHVKHSESKVDSKGFIYVISNPAWPNTYKIGKTYDISKRLNSYQTYSPNRDYKIEYCCKCTLFHSKELSIIEECKFQGLKVSGEWVYCTKKKDLLNIIKTVIPMSDIIHTEEFTLI